MDKMRFGVALTTVLCALPSCAGKKDAAKMNFLFIVSEDNGKNLGCYGAPVETPNLDLAVRFYDQVVDTGLVHVAIPYAEYMDIAR